ncbi:Ribonuclease H [Saliniradius amylolyticus]|uniref:Ribonuclease HII n=1 Tax=Saliniradius amylolyticus TaxID=2183582 RepID=A0A2S2E4K8_9ALTE|nr:ribonuclease HII [Saliniradius amylolyticus]AWL12598.1 Ribonuclease H [Saliniradius amylolyticus]
MSQAVSALIAGVDEVGRGPLVGDVVTAAVILQPDRPIEGLTDSKALSEKRREALFDIIQTQALCWNVGRATPAEIDQMNILSATMLAMERAVEGLSHQPQHVLVDGNRCPNWSYSSEAVVKGDSRVAAISAASILAKVTRDREMQQLEQDYPGYGFAQHKGYPTKQHLQSLSELGPTPFHRLSFKPVQKALEAHRGVSNG